MMPSPTDAQVAAELLFWFLAAIVVAGTIADTLEGLQRRPR